MVTRGLDHWSDILVVVIYFVVVLAVGLWAFWRHTRGTVNSYFLAGRQMTWFPIGASIYSSNIGTEHFIGLAGSGAAAGIAMISYEWTGLPLIALAAWFFLPVYISAKVYTLPEYLGKRFGGQRIRIYMSVLSLLLYIVTKLAVSIFSGALFIQLALGWNNYASIASLLVITGLYTVLGGLTAVIYTDALQTIILTVGSFIVVGISFNKIGGYGQFQKKYMEAYPSIRNENTTCGMPRDDAFHIFRDPVNSDNPWPGLLLQSSIGCLWYWCCDQVIVQRSLAARNLSHAKGGALLAGYLKMLPLVMMIFPGMISRALYPDEVGCADPEECTKYCDNPVGCSNIAYPKLVLELLPYGVRGLLMAVMLSANMSSLTSIFNSSSTIFTMDLWRRMRPTARQRELLIVGRIFIVALCVVSILWIPLVRSSQGGQLFAYINAVQSYLGTPIGALFLLAVAWKRMTEQGAFWGIAIGHMCGIIRLGLDMAYPAPGCGEEDTRPSVLANLHYTYFGALMILITSLAIVIISLLTEAQTEEQIKDLTWKTRITTERNKEDSGDEMFTVNTIMSVEKPNASNESLPAASESSADSRPLWRRWVTEICGQSSKKDPHEDLVFDDKQTNAFLFEDPKWRSTHNITFVIGMVVTGFLYGIFN
ncbi:sodium/mannose cotransporter SLC5A10-like [Saccostrea echinata]|uniref:sodium/mannose cotransporter SLC5A10-like n=1 Tax=Saccostrea echinata TaxID=191078 RepID=UPI002A806D30|nr:sodium/mannose cotransporter SLC5A10-like [Saccostrea echinata]